MEAFIQYWKKIIYKTNIFRFQFIIYILNFITLFRHNMENPSSSIFLHSLVVDVAVVVAVVVEVFLIPKDFSGWYQHELPDFAEPREVE